MELISEKEIETYAVQMAEPDFELSMASINAQIGHLDVPDYNAVLARAARIARERGEADLAEADALKSLLHLAKATGVPGGGKPFRWLQNLGLIEQVDGRFRFKAAKPEPMT